jgi:manganese efflux pump family protein
MAIATLVTWLLTAGIGAFMLRTWIARGGPRMRRAGADRLPPVVVYGHASLALTGLTIWISYVATGLAALAWAGACLLMPVIGLGAAMVTVWTPYPIPRADRAGSPPGDDVGGVLAAPAEDAMHGRVTDEMFARALTDDALAGRLTDEVLARVSAGSSRPARKHQDYLAPLIPAGHGVAALTTFLLAVVTAVGVR